MKENRYFYLFGFLINYSLLIVMSGSLLFEYTSRFVFVVSVISWIVFIVLHRFRRFTGDIIKAAFMLYGIALIGHYGGYQFNRTTALFLEKLFIVLNGDYIIGLFTQIIQFYGNQLEMIPELLDEKVFILVAAGITYLVMMLVHRRSIRLLFLLPPLFFLIQWIRYVDISFVAIRWYMVGFIGYSIYVLSQVNWSRHKSPYNKFTQRDYFIYSLSIATAIMVLTSFLFAVYPLKRINEQFSGFMPTFSSLRTGYTARSDQYVYSFEYSMYMPNGDLLGGRITDRNYDEVMLIKSSRGGQYLRGNVKDYYSGNSWSNTDPTYRNRINYSIRELPHYDLTVYPTNIQTATLFAPLNIRSIDLNVNKVYVNRDEIYYYNRDSLENKLSSYEMTVYGKSVNHMMTSSLDPYLQLPDSISERLIDLSLLITNDDSVASSKIESIRDYLKDNYPYTLFVNSVPREVEFVDYFIFEEKKGYCTYFASAAAVMARINGIPSRYVEGYLSEIEENNLGYYEVTGDRAHAWAEVYIDGVWQTVEATPHYLDELVETEFEIEVSEETRVDDIDRPELDEELLEPDMPIQPDISANPIDWSGYLTVGLTSVMILVIWWWIRRRGRRYSVKKRLNILVRMVESDETVVQHTRIPENLLNEYSMNSLGYRIAKDKIILIQKLLYSTIDLNLDEKNTIIEEMTAIEKRMKEYHGRMRFNRIRRRVLK